ncbi:MAG: DNA lyase [Dehalococcoidia bacterium]|nr:DNA lyase [Dehalococcoidia bacterium]MXZ88801.1 DNA lyase [Dehalococcoidia bacterium]MYJ12046.1 DNA lyase [Gemmatimonadota bacterium]
MRLWSLHPKYLDTKGLVAVWREGLLAQRVLGGHTRGYRKHPQLERFRHHPAPRNAIALYLEGVFAEARLRGHRFDRSKIEAVIEPVSAMEVTEGQLRYELSHLAGKLKARDPKRLDQLSQDQVPEAHPLFVVVPGPIASWERPSNPP